MTETLDYRDKFIIEKIEGLTKLMNAQFESMEDKLDAIHNQAVLTNSRVTKLEDHKEKFQHYVDTHPGTCPNLYLIKKTENDLNELETKLQDVNFFIRHPKLSLTAGILIMLFTTATMYTSVFGWIKNKPFNNHTITIVDSTKYKPQLKITK